MPVCNDKVVKGRLRLVQCLLYLAFKITLLQGFSYFLTVLLCKLPSCHQIVYCCWIMRKIQGLMHTFHYVTVICHNFAGKESGCAESYVHSEVPESHGYDMMTLRQCCLLRLLVSYALGHEQSGQVVNSDNRFFASCRLSCVTWSVVLVICSLFHVTWTVGLVISSLFRVTWSIGLVICSLPCLTTWHSTWPYCWTPVPWNV